MTMTVRYLLLSEHMRWPGSFFTLAEGANQSSRSSATLQPHFFPRLNVPRPRACRTASILTVRSSSDGKDVLLFQLTIFHHVQTRTSSRWCTSRRSLQAPQRCKTRSYVLHMAQHLLNHAIPHDRRSRYQLRAEILRGARCIERRCFLPEM